MWISGLISDLECSSLSPSALSLSASCDEEIWAPIRQFHAPDWLTGLYNVPTQKQFVMNVEQAVQLYLAGAGDWRLYLHLDNVAARFMVEIIRASAVRGNQTLN